MSKINKINRINKINKITSLKREKYPWKAFKIPALCLEKSPDTLFHEKFKVEVITCCFTNFETLG